MTISRIHDKKKHLWPNDELGAKPGPQQRFTHCINIYVTGEMAEAIRSLADEYGITRSDLIRTALQKELDKE